jgi:hypothetical protein
MSPVIAHTALGVPQKLVGAGDGPEPILRRRVTSAQVRMGIAHLPVVGADDFLTVGVRRHSEHLVRISGAGMCRHQDHLRPEHEVLHRDPVENLSEVLSSFHTSAI